mgnify:CR=1 FL=1
MPDALSDPLIGASNIIHHFQLAECFVEIIKKFSMCAMYALCYWQFSNKGHFHFKSDNSAFTFFEPLKSDEIFGDFGT